MDEHEKRQGDRHGEFEQYWLCIGVRRWRLPAHLHMLIAALFAGMHKLLPKRVGCDTWIRYRRKLGDVSTPTQGILTPLSNDLVEGLRKHPQRDRDQMRSGIRFWEHGLRNAFIWLEDQEPLCMQWLFLPTDNAQLQALPGWSDLYVPLPPNVGHAENIFTFPRGLRRRGGAATEFALAVFAHARQSGLTHLYTNAHEHNLGARRWAERTGWQAYGAIRRYRLDFPLLRDIRWCLHGVEPVLPLPGSVSAPQSQRPVIERGLADELPIARLAGH